jgi:hypothetical protein
VLADEVDAPGALHTPRFDPEPPTNSQPPATHALALPRSRRCVRAH